MISPARFNELLHLIENAIEDEDYDEIDIIEAELYQLDAAALSHEERI
jgi:hypothetical protein